MNSGQMPSPPLANDFVAFREDKHESGRTGDRTMRVPYKIGSYTPLKEYALRFLIMAAGYQPHRCTSNEDALVYYGDRSDCNGRGKVVIPVRPADAQAPPLTGASTVEGELETDIVSATGALLSDQVNAAVTEFDRFTRIRFKDSYQHHQNIHYSAPTVDRYVNLFRERLAREFGPGIARWPEGKTSVIGLSHDVDRLDRWAGLRSLWRGHVHRFAWTVFKNLRARHDDGALLLELGEIERRYGYKSTFFFASVNQFESKNVKDISYSVGRPFVMDLMRQLLKQGHEIGLHASFDAYHSAERFIEEKKKLEDALGASVVGLRHHYWHLGANVERTLGFHEAAGFQYDSSLAFNEDPGYRRSVALPYYPWDSKDQRPIGVLQIPVCAMDGAYFYHQGMTAEKCLEEMMPLLNEVDEVGGVATLDWHSDTSHPGTTGFQERGQAYIGILQALSRQPSRWVTSLGEIAQWTKQYHEKLGYSVH